MESIKMESKTYQYRKITKPLLERKRRARINKCLDNLKDLMIDSMRQQGDNIARLEKADILELTVEHLRKIKDTSTTIEPSSSTTTTRTLNVDSFRSGYIHAANEVSRALSTYSRVDIELGTKLMTHLGHRLNQIQHQQQEKFIIKKCISPVAIPSSENGSIPLNIYCGNDNHISYTTKMMMISPSPSSGYGSDSEFSSSSSSSVTNVWRPW